MRRRSAAFGRQGVRCCRDEDDIAGPSVNILYISAHLPSSSIPQAGHKTAFAHLMEYTRDNNVYALVFMNEKEKPYLKMDEFADCKEVHIVPIGWWSRVVHAASHPLLPVKVSSRASWHAKQIIADILGRLHIELAHFEFTAAGVFQPLVGSNVKQVFSEHDVGYQASERRAQRARGLTRLVLSIEARRQKEWELTILRSVDSIIVQSKKDLLLLSAEGIDLAKIRVVSPFIGPESHGIVRNDIESGSMLFWGAMDRLENQEAVLWFAEACMPKVLREHPDAKLYVVGANPPDKIRRLQSANIVVTGYVESPRTYFERCQIGLAPLLRGAGIKVKVLECVNAGIPVVSTEIGAEGIDHPLVRVVHDLKRYADVIIAELKK